MPRNWIERIVYLRWAVVGFVALTTLVAGILASKVRFDNSIEIWFLEGDPELASYNQFTERFGGDEFVVIGMAADDVFSRPVLESIERLTQLAAAKPHVLGVRSLTSVAFPEPHAGLPEDAMLGAARERLLGSAVERGWLVTPDAKVTAVLVSMAREGNTVEGKNALVGALRELVEVERGRSPGIRFFMAGTPVLDEAFFRYNNRDLTLLLPLSITLVLLVGLVAFRRPGAALLQLAVVAVAVIWVFGLMGLLGLKMSVISTVLPPLLLAIGVANSVHIISEYYRRIAAGSPRNRAVAESAGHLLKPCFFTSLTTVAGLLSLLVSPMQPVREFAALAATGVGFAFLLSIVFLPAMLALLPTPKSESADRLATGFLRRLLSRVDHCSRHWPRSIVLVGALLLIGSLFAVARLKVGIYALDWFPGNAPVALDLRQADRDLGGSSTLEFLISAPDGGLAEPAVLERLYDFERWLETEVPGVTKAISIADVQRELPAPPGSDPSRLSIEAQFDEFHRIQPGEFDRLLDAGHSLGRVSARIRLDQSTEVVHAFDRIAEKIAADIDGPGLSVKMTGYIRLMGKMEHYLIVSQIQSFVLAFAVITLMMTVLLRSLKLGLFAMIPNFLPVAMGLGTMALAGIGLSPGTIMIGAIALGLVVDDTVHFLVALRRELARNPDLDAAITETLHTTGRPIVLTSVILMAGFAVLTCGSFNPSIQFGAISALVIGFALLADLLLLPAALRLMRPKPPRA